MRNFGFSSSEGSKRGRTIYVYIRLRLFHFRDLRQLEPVEPRSWLREGDLAYITDQLTLCAVEVETTGDRSGELTRFNIQRPGSLEIRLIVSFLQLYLSCIKSINLLLQQVEVRAVQASNLS